MCLKIGATKFHVLNLYFKNFENIAQFSLASTVSDEKSHINLVLFPCRQCFFLSAFRILYPSCCEFSVGYSYKGMFSNAIWHLVDSRPKTEERHLLLSLWLRLPKCCHSTILHLRLLVLGYRNFSPTYHPFY